MLNVVLDTNILVSSIFWEKGNPHKIVELALDKKINVFVSNEILDELSEVLRRDFEEPEDVIKRQIDLILNYAEFVESVVKVDVVKDDPKDNMIIECAVSSDADYLITGDKHLLVLKNYEKIKIVSARDFIEKNCL